MHYMHLSMSKACQVSTDSPWPKDWNSEFKHMEKSFLCEVNIKFFNYKSPNFLCIMKMAGLRSICIRKF